MRDAAGLGCLRQSQGAGTGSPSPLPSEARELSGLLLGACMQLAGLSGEQSPPSPAQQSPREEETEVHMEQHGCPTYTEPRFRLTQQRSRCKGHRSSVRTCGKHNPSYLTRLHSRSRQTHARPPTPTESGC